MATTRRPAITDARTIPMVRAIVRSAIAVGSPTTTVPETWVPVLGELSVPCEATSR